MTRVLDVEDTIGGSLAKYFNMLREENHKEALTTEKDILKEVKTVYRNDEQDIVSGYKNGTSRTQHGVNAEHICIAEFNIKEARLAKLEGREPIYMEKSSAVNGPDDMIRGDEIFQAKYYQTAKGSLEGCIEHLNKYSESYANNAKAHYVIPDEQYQILLDIKSGSIPEGFTERTAKTLRDKIEVFERLKGESIESAMQSGEVTYEKAHQVHNEAENNARRKRIKGEHEEAKEELKEKYSANLAECIKSSLIAAGFAGLFSSAIHIYRDYHDGKNIFMGEYAGVDYKNLGITAVKSAGAAAVTSGALYWINAAAKGHAGYVAALANITKAIAPLKLAYLKGDITLNELMGAAYAVSISIMAGALGEGGMSLLITSAVGMLASANIVVPGAAIIIAGMIGGLIATTLTSKLLTCVDEFLGEDIKVIMAKRDSFIADLNETFNIKYQHIEASFKDTAALIKQSSDLSTSALNRLEAMAKMSKHYDGMHVDINPDVDALRARFFG